ncbi:MAG: methyltransferase domain-containing protein [Gammaproteobacteria bacterium]|nr:methyltransferase domain-containing protein [Gammaproteobacteria bacterium]
MSEGGDEAIDNMFAGIPLHNKTVLDIGAGLGGAAFHVAEKYQATVYGVELSSWLVQEAQRRIPDALKGKVDFVAYSPPTLPFDHNFFDIIYSKGVFTHVKDKAPLFKEVFRTLKPNGLFVIDDWLSPVKDQWGPNITKMATEENLLLYAETETNYEKLLTSCGFSDIKTRNENKNYFRYNNNIVRHLEQKEVAEYFRKAFGEVAYQQALDSYCLIAKAVDENELLIRSFVAKKENF